MVFKKIDEERRLQKVRSQCTRDCEKSTRSSWSGRCLTIYSNIQSALCTDGIMPHTETTEIIGTYNQSNLMARMRHIPLNGHIWFIISFVSQFWSSSKCPKSTRHSKLFLSTWKYSLSEENFSQSWRNTLRHLLLDNIANYPVWFTMLTNNISSNLSLQKATPKLDPLSSA